MSIFDRINYKLTTGLLLTVLLIIGGLAIQYRDFLTISLLVDRPLRGAMWSSVVRHSVVHNGEEIYCYDEGSRFCEEVLARVTGNQQLEFEKQRNLGYAFAPRLDIGDLAHHTLYSCANLSDARAGTYTYRVTTDRSVCEGIGAFPYALGQILVNPGDLEVPLALRQDAGYLSTYDPTNASGIIGYLAAVQVNQLANPGEVPDTTTLCDLVRQQCFGETRSAICQTAVPLCSNIPLGDFANLYDLDDNGCVGEGDLDAITAQVGQTPDGATAKYDVNFDGAIDALDVMAVTEFIDNPTNAAFVCDEPTTGPGDGDDGGDGTGGGSTPTPTPTDGSATPTPAPTDDGSAIPTPTTTPSPTPTPIPTPADGRETLVRQYGFNEGAGNIIRDELSGETITIPASIDPGDLWVTSNVVPLPSNPAGIALSPDFADIELHDTTFRSISFWYRSTTPDQGFTPLLRIEENANFGLTLNNTQACSNTGSGEVVHVHGLAEGDPNTILLTPGRVSSQAIDGVPGAWNHVAVVLRGADHRAEVYVNGETEGPGSQVDALRTLGEGPLRIGGGFTGVIDDFRIYSDELSHAAIRDIASSAGAIRPAAAEYSFDANVSGTDVLVTHANSCHANGTVPVSLRSTSELAPLPNNVGSVVSSDHYLDAAAAQPLALPAAAIGRDDGAVSLWFKAPPLATVTNQFGEDGIRITLLGVTPTIDTSLGTLSDAPALAWLEGDNRVAVGNFDGTLDQVSTSYQPEVWNHLAWVHREDRLYGYLNGSQFGSVVSGRSQWPSFLQAAFERVRSGFASNTTPGWQTYVASLGDVTGYIDQVSFFGHSLSDDEVQALYDQRTNQ